MKIGNKELVEIFGNDKHKQYYSKYKRVPKDMKNSILKIVSEEYNKVEDLGRGRYLLEDKIGTSIIIPNNKMNHGIYGNLIPSILINVKEYHDEKKVFCLSLNSLYFTLNMININYINMTYRKNTTSKILDIGFDTVNEFFDVVHDYLKYYLESALKLMKSLKLINYYMIPYIRENNKQTQHFDESDLTLNENKITSRRASKEEIQFIEDLKFSLLKKYKINDTKYSKEYFNYTKELNSILKSKNIINYYENYELICLNKDAINEIVNYYDINNKEILSENFCNNFIDLVMNNAEGRHKKAIQNNLESFYRFSKKYLDDFLKLSNTTLDFNSEKIFVPKQKILHIEDDKGGYINKIQPTD